MSVSGDAGKDRARGGETNRLSRRWCGLLRKAGDLVPSATSLGLIAASLGSFVSIPAKADDSLSLSFEAGAAAHVVLGDLASRSQRNAITVGGSGPYTVVGTDSRTGNAYSYSTDVNYNAGTGRESDERAYGSFSFNRSTATYDGRADVEYLSSSGNCNAGNTFDGLTTFCSVFGPEVWTTAFGADGGKALAFDYAASASDNYEIYAFLVKVNCVDDSDVSTCDYGGGKGEGGAGDPLDTHTLVAYGRGKNASWTTATGIVPETGTYRFRFVDGSYDQTGGYALGTNFYIDPASVVVGNAQTIGFPAVADQILGDGVFEVAASSSAGLPVTLNSVTTGVCTVSGTTITPIDTGICTLTANAEGGVAGDGETYIAAATVTRSLAILANPTAPSNTGLPTIFGIAEQGNTLTTDEGTWGTGGSAFTSTAYQWIEVVGGVDADIDGATTDRLCVPASVVGANLKFRVTKTNAIGSTTATSLATAAVLASLEVCPDIIQEYEDDRTHCQVSGCGATTQDGNKIVEVSGLDADGESEDSTGNQVDIRVITELADPTGPIVHELTVRDSEGDELTTTRMRSELPGSTTVVDTDEQGRPRVVTSATADTGVQYEVQAQYDGKALHRVTPPGGTASEAVSNIAGAQTLVTADGKVETGVESPVESGQRIRAMVITQASGEGQTRYERYDDLVADWVTVSPTLDPISSFEPGHRAVIEKVDGNLSMRIRFRLTRDLYF